MIDLLTIFGKGGIVLWCFQEGTQLFASSINELIKEVFLQVAFRSPSSPSPQRLPKNNRLKAIPPRATARERAARRNEGTERARRNIYASAVQLPRITRRRLRALLSILGNCTEKMTN